MSTESSSSLYRFLSFESFVDIIQSESLKLVQPKLWEDPYESYLLKAIKSESGRIKVKGLLDEIYDNNEESSNFAFLTLNSLMSNYYGQCWTTNPESDAFWRIYSYDKKAIRLEIDYDSINKLKNVHPYVHPYPVEYIDDVSLKKELEIVTNKHVEFGGLSLEKAFIRKRRAFEHEHEVRLLISIENEDNILKDKPTVSSNEIINDLGLKLAELGINIRDVIAIDDEIPSIEVSDSIEFNNGNNVIPYIQINYAHIHNFIKSVMLHPLAPAWFDSTLSDYCKINNINYLGKSKLYNLEIESI